jgi:hypothetical protein
MSKNRLPLLMLVAAGLAVLLWWDNRSQDTPRSRGDVIHPGQGDLAANFDSSGSAPSSPAEDGQAYAATPLDKEALKEMVERPLFAPSRRRPPVKAPVETRIQASAPIAPPPRPNYSLLGVIRDGDRAIALLRSHRDGRNIRVEAGDTLGGWQITAVDSMSVTLKRDDAGDHKIRLSGQ